MLPLAFEMKDLPVLVLGAGNVGARKVSQLLDAGARVDVISENVNAELPPGVSSLKVRRYATGDLDNYWLVVSAIGDPLINELVVQEAFRLRVWLNVVDDPVRSTFYFTALHRQGDVVVAVSTQGASPALAQELRDIVAAALPKNVAQVAEQLRGARHLIHSTGESTEGIDWQRRVRSLLYDSGVPQIATG